MSQQFKKGEITVCIVNYKTELLTKLCLRSIRRFADSRWPMRVVVVDNDSKNDPTLDYLRSLKWITLIERPGQVIKGGSWAHGTGLDCGLAVTDTEYFLAMHSDTFVFRPDWLEKLMTPFVKDPDTACSGTGKLDLKPAWMNFLKKYTDVKEWLRKIDPKSKRRDFYIRAICAVYKTELLKADNLSFAMDEDKGMTCAQQLYYKLLDKGCRTAPLSPYDIAGSIHHLAHATMVLNPEFTVRKRTEKNCRRDLKRILESPLAREILADESLDK